MQKLKDMDVTDRQISDANWQGDVAKSSTIWMCPSYLEFTLTMSASLQFWIRRSPCQLSLWRTSRDFPARKLQEAKTPLDLKRAMTCFSTPIVRSIRIFTGVQSFHLWPSRAFVTCGQPLVSLCTQKGSQESLTEMWEHPEAPWKTVFQLVMLR